MASSHLPLPAGPDELDPPWLTQAMRSSGALDDGSRVTGVHAVAVEIGGVNGDVFRLHASYDGAPGPPTLIAKFPPAALGSRGVANFQRWYEREVRAYRELNADGTLPMPGCYFAELAEDGGFILLLEDLGAQRLGDQLAGCSADEAAAVIRTIAAPHARWWDAREITTGLDWLPRTTVGVDRARGIQGAFARSWGVVGSSINAPAGFADIAARAIDHYPMLLEEAAAPPLTVIHGDYRLDNLFFDGPADTPRVTVIDWQFTSRCRGTYDVAYFLGLDLEIEQRRLIEQPMLELYQRSLADAGVRDYSIDACRHDYALCLMLAFATFVIGAAGQQANERMRRVHEVGLQRLAAAIVDVDAAALLA